MILHVHVPDEPSYEIGDEIWQQSLAVAIRSAAETIAARSQSSEPADQAHRAALLERIVAAMTCALVRVGDTYRAPDGVLCSLTAGPLELDPHRHKGRLASMTRPSRAPIIEEVLRFEDLPPGSLASRRAVVRWSDGSEGEALRWYADEMLSPAHQADGA